MSEGLIEQEFTADPSGSFGISFFQMGSGGKQFDFNNSTFSLTPTTPVLLTGGVVLDGVGAGLTGFNGLYRAILTTDTTVWTDGGYFLRLHDLNAEPTGLAVYGAGFLLPVKAGSNIPTFPGSGSGGAPTAAENAAAVWAAVSRTLTASLDPSASAIATAVWATVSRTLTATLDPDAATVAAAVWSAVTRTLTAGATPPTALENAAAVWASVSRTLTASLDPSSSAISAAVWAAVSRTMTASLDPNAATISAAVWAALNRSLTDKAGFALAPSGLNLIFPEPSQPIGLPQAIALILADAAGRISGVDTLNPIVKQSVMSGTPEDRITLTTDSSGNRTVVTLTLPALPT